MEMSNELAKIMEKRRQRAESAKQEEISFVDKKSNEATTMTITTIPQDQPATTVMPKNNNRNFTWPPKRPESSASVNESHDILDDEKIASHSVATTRNFSSAQMSSYPNPNETSKMHGDSWMKHKSAAINEHVVALDDDAPDDEKLGFPANFSASAFTAADDAPDDKKLVTTGDQPPFQGIVATTFVKSVALTDGSDEPEIGEPNVPHDEMTSAVNNNTAAFAATFSTDFIGVGEPASEINISDNHSRNSSSSSSEEEGVVREYHDKITHNSSNLVHTGATNLDGSSAGSLYSSVEEGDRLSVSRNDDDDNDDDDASNNSDLPVSVGEDDNAGMHTNLSESDSGASSYTNTVSHTTVQYHMHARMTKVYSPAGVVPTIKATCNPLTGNAILIMADDDDSSSNLACAEIAMEKKSYTIVHYIPLHSNELERKCAQSGLFDGGSLLTVSEVSHVISGTKRVCVVAKLSYTDISTKKHHDTRVVLVYNWPVGLQVAMPLPPNAIPATLCVADGMMFVATEQRAILVTKLQSSYTNSPQFNSCVSSDELIGCACMCIIKSFKCLVAGCSGQVFLFSYVSLWKKKRGGLGLVCRFDVRGACICLEMHPTLPLLCAVSTDTITIYNLQSKAILAKYELHSIVHSVSVAWLDDFSAPALAIFMGDSHIEYYQLEPSFDNSAEHKGVLHMFHSEPIDDGYRSISILPGMICQVKDKFYMNGLCKMQFMGVDNTGLTEESSTTMMGSRIPVGEYNIAVACVDSGLTDTGDFECKPTIHILSHFDTNLVDMRYWLCSTSCTFDACAETSSAEEKTEVGGSKTTLISEIKFSRSANHHSLVPCGIRRRNNSFIVLFKYDFILSEPCLFIMYDLQEKGTITCNSVSGSDVAFVDDSTILVLSEIGDCITSFNLIEGKLVEANSTSLSSVALTGKRIFYLNKKIYILASNGGQQCLIRGYVSSNGDSLWLEEEEELFNLISLPSGGDFNNLALSSNKRVMILDGDNLRVLSEFFGRVQCSTLCGIGSNCVAFLDSTGKATSLRYLNTLASTEFSSNVICNLPFAANKRNRNKNYLLLHLVQDRISYLQNSTCIYSPRSSGSKVTGGYDAGLVFPMPTTHPIASFLEPLVSNALCLKDKDVVLRQVIDKFGRKKSGFPHMDNEGIGCLGIGLTDTVYKMLIAENEHAAAELLLLGSQSTGSLTSHNILPKWLPLAIQSHVSIRAANVAFDPTSDNSRNEAGRTLALDLGCDALKKGNLQEAIKFLLYSGSETSDRILLEILLSTKRSNANDLLKCVSDHSANSIAGSLARLALDLQRDDSVDQTIIYDIDDAISPSSLRSSKHRPHQIVDKRPPEVSVEFDSPDENLPDNVVWDAPILDTNHVWHRGPCDKQEHLLLLDRFEEWLGRSKPTLIGKSGIVDSGEKKLADILAAAQTNREVGQSGFEEEDSRCSGNARWVTGIGEGRDDEDFISAYYRFSEGSEEEGQVDWITNGVNDISKHRHTAIIYGSEMASLETTTSGVDDGEPDKVKQSYDLVFNENIDQDTARGVAIEVIRGDSLDVGVLHELQHESRRKASLEIWFNPCEYGSQRNEVILMRRSISTKGSDLSKLCSVSSDGMIWELALLPTGHLEFRTNSTIVSTCKDTDEENEADNSAVVAWQRDDGGRGWNHVCLVICPNSFSDLPSSSSVKIYMKGELVCASDVSFIITTEHENVDDALERTALLFGLGAYSGFRMTEIRIWSCERKVDDIRQMMYEYLSIAECKKKFTFKIRNKSKSSGKMLSGFLPPPSGRSTSIKLLQPGGSIKPLPPLRKPGNSPPTQPVGDPNEAFSTSPFVATFEEVFQENSPHNKNETEALIANEHLSGGLDSLQDPLGEKDTFVAGLEASNTFGVFEAEPYNNLTTSEQSNEDLFRPSAGEAVTWESTDMAFKSPIGAEKEESATFPKSFNAFGGDTDLTSFSPFPHDDPPTSLPSNSGGNKLDFDDDQSSPLHELNEMRSEGWGDLQENQSDSMDYVQTLSFELCADLSEDVGPAAAAALVRGPPATQHFGGNRGGILSDGRNENFGVNSIAVCGSERTVVYSALREPCARTYTVGASGAIVSDPADRNGLEHMCCFFAGENMLSIIDLERQEIIANQNMKTKLNFWRYLPPLAHGNKLVFMLVTPIGGFHWMPLEDDSRPRRVWKRGAELLDKKLLAYEEGGSNGFSGHQSRSTVALLLVTPKSIEERNEHSPLAVEAWCLHLGSSSTTPLCADSDAQGAALFRPNSLGIDDMPYRPLLCLVSTDNTSDMVGYAVRIHKLSKLPPQTAESQPSLVLDIKLATTRLDMSDYSDTSYECPSKLVMGDSPNVIVLCHDDHIVLAMRQYGLIVAYAFSEEGLSLLGLSPLKKFIVDATVRSGEIEGEIEVVALVSDSVDKKQSDDSSTVDGQIVVVPISKGGF